MASADKKLSQLPVSVTDKTSFPVVFLLPIKVYIKQMLNTVVSPGILCFGLFICHLRKDREKIGLLGQGKNIGQ